MQTSKQRNITTKTTTANDGLASILGLGPARIAALEAAGIKTRSALAQATIEQLVAIKGFRQVAAEKILSSLQGEAVPVPPATPTRRPRVGRPPRTSPHVVLSLSVPTATESVSKPKSPAKKLPSLSVILEKEPVPAADMERALLTVRTALADATRKFAALDGPLTKLARRVEKLPAKVERLSDKQRAKIADRLDQLSGRLEKASRRADDLTKVQRAKLAERIENERAVIDYLVKANGAKAKK